MKMKLNFVTEKLKPKTKTKNHEKESETERTEINGKRKASQMRKN